MNESKGISAAHELPLFNFGSEVRTATAEHKQATG